MEKQQVIIKDDNDKIRRITVKDTFEEAVETVEMFRSIEYGIGSFEIRRFEP